MYVARWVFAIRNCWTNQMNAISCVRSVVFFVAKLNCFVSFLSIPRTCSLLFLDSFALIVGAVHTNPPANSRCFFFFFQYSQNIVVSGGITLVLGFRRYDGGDSIPTSGPYGRLLGLLRPKCVIVLCVSLLFALMYFCCCLVKRPFFVCFPSSY